MPEEQLTKKEEYELRQQEKKIAKDPVVSKKTYRRIVNYALLIIIISALGYGIYFLTDVTGPQGEDFSRAVPIMEDISHYAVGFSEDFEYNSNPPTSGPHYSETAMSGFRDEQIPDGHLIHNLEHGDIWISFHPRVSDEVKEQLKQFTAAKVIITARDKNDTDIALAAWGRLDTFDLENDIVPEQRISDFIKRYMGQGPERIPGASGGI